MKRSSISLKTNKVIPLNQYTGRWVAFLGEKIVESGRTLKSLMKKVKKKKLEKKVSVFLVPKKSEGPYIF